MKKTAKKGKQGSGGRNEPKWRKAKCIYAHISLSIYGFTTTT